MTALDIFHCINNELCTFVKSFGKYVVPLYYFVFTVHFDNIQFAFVGLIVERSSMFQVVFICSSLISCYGSNISRSLREVKPDPFTYAVPSYVLSIFADLSAEFSRITVDMTVAKIKWFLICTT
jgi:hypothetical protein